MSGVNVDFIIRHTVNEHALKYGPSKTYSEMFEDIVQTSIKELNEHGIIGNDLKYIVERYVEYLLKDKYKNNM